MAIWVRNNTAAVITRGQAVYSDGTAGGLPRVALARANAAGTMPCLGIALEHIDPSQDGRIGTLEAVTAMDTSSFALGNLLYVSGATAGALTATAPTTPNLTQRVGRVTAVDARDGTMSIQVEAFTAAPDNSFEIIGSAPELRFTETDQTDPAGRWRFRINVDTMYLEHAATATWGTANEVFNIAYPAQGSTTQSVVSIDGRLGVSPSTEFSNPTGTFAISGTFLFAQTTGANAGVFQGVIGTVSSSTNTTQNLTAAVGLRGVQGDVNVRGSQTVTGVANFYSSGLSLAGAVVVTNAYGIYLANLGAPTNKWGVYIEDQNGALTLNVGLEWASHLRYSANAFAFQEATTISTVAAANLTLNPFTTGALILQSGGTEFLRLNNTGVGFFAVAPVARQTSGANLTNSVTSGGTDDTIANFTDLAIYSNDAAAIRNDIYQLARKLKQVNDSLRSYGLLT